MDIDVCANIFFSVGLYTAKPATPPARPPTRSIYLRFYEGALASRRRTLSRTRARALSLFLSLAVGQILQIHRGSVYVVVAGAAAVVLLHNNASTEHTSACLPGCASSA